MKKCSVLMFAAVSLLLASFFVSCSNGSKDYTVSVPDGVDLRTDVLDLEKPSLQGKAYYGVNYVWWNAVAGANSYSLYRNGSFIKSFAKDSAGLFYQDGDVSEGREYEYQVVAVSKSDPSREANPVSVRSSAATIKLTGKVPSLEVYQKAVEDSLSIKDGVSSKISVTAGRDGYIIVEFPTKAWLQYTIYSVTKGLVTSYNDPLGISTVKDSSTTVYPYYEEENGTCRRAVPVTSAGEKEIYVLAQPKVTSSNMQRLYGWGDTLVASDKTVTYAKLYESSSTYGLKAVWTDTTAKKARVYWTPAKNASGVFAPTTEFKVYRKVADDWTQVSGTVTATTTKDYYYIDDVLPAITVDAKYYVVHTDGTSYGTKAEPVTLAATSLGTADVATVTASSTSLDEDGIANDIRVKVVVPTDVTLSAIEYSKTDIYDSEWKLFKSDYNFTAVEIPANYTFDDEARKVYIVAVKDLADSWYYFRVTTTKEGFDNGYASKTIEVDPSAPATDNPTLSVEIGDYADDGTANDAFITVKAGNEKQTLTLAYGYSAVNEDAARVAYYSAPELVELPELYSEAVTNVAKSYQFIKENLKDGYYYFVVTAEETGKSSVTTVLQSRVDTTISATTDNPTLSIVKKAYGSDEKENDLYFVVAKGNDEQTLKLFYGYSDKTAKAAEAVARTAPVTVELPKDEEGYNNTFRFSKEDFADGYYYFYLVAEEKDLKPSEAVSEIAIDTVVEKISGTPWWFWSDWIDSNDKSKGVTFKIKGSNDVKFEMAYGYSADSREEAEYKAYTAPVAVTVPTERTSVGWGVLYGFDVVTAEPGYYWFVVKSSQDGATPVTIDVRNYGEWRDAEYGYYWVGHYEDEYGYDDDGVWRVIGRNWIDDYLEYGIINPAGWYEIPNSLYYAQGLYREVPIPAVSEEDPLPARPRFSTMRFENKDSDGKYNDLADFTVTVDGKTSLKTVKYAAGVSEVEARYLAVSSTKTIAVPTSYVYSISSEDSTKKYSFKDVLKDVDVVDANGNYLYYAFVAECDDEDAENWNGVSNAADYAGDYDIPVIPASWYTNDDYVRINSKPTLQVLLRNKDTAADSYANDIAVTVKDQILADDTVSNYTYKVQYAVEELDYSGYSITWKDLQAIDALSVEDAAANKYIATFAKDNLADGNYFFRLIKQSKLGGDDIIATIWDSYRIEKPANQTTNSDTLNSINIRVSTANDTSNPPKRTVSKLRLYFDNLNNTATAPDANYTYTIYRASWVYNYHDASDYNRFDKIEIDNYAEVSKPMTAETNNANWYDVVDTITEDGKYFYYVKAENKTTHEVVYSNKVTIN